MDAENCLCQGFIFFKCTSTSLFTDGTFFVLFIKIWTIFMSIFFQFCQTWPPKFGQILLRNDTRLVFCNGKLMRTDIFFTRTTKPICNFVNPVVRKDMDGLSIRGSIRYLSVSGLYILQVYQYFTIYRWYIFCTFY
jgi:hypothetical protein